MGFLSDRYRIIGDFQLFIYMSKIFCGINCLFYIHRQPPITDDGTMKGGEFLSIDPKNEQHTSVCKRMIDKEIIFFIWQTRR
jgi:hypothetical protein